MRCTGVMVGVAAAAMGLFVRIAKDRDLGACASGESAQRGC